MIVAVENGLNRHWSGSQLDVVSTSLMVTNYFDRTVPSCDNLLNLEWKREATSFIKEEVCGRTKLSAVMSTKVHDNTAELTQDQFNSSTDITQNGCDDTGFLIGLFNAFSENNFHDLEPVDKHIQQSHSYNQEESPINCATESFQKLSELPLSVNHSSFTSPEFISKFRTGYCGFHNVSRGKLRQRLCHSESDIGPQVEFGQPTLRDSVKHCLSLITLSSSFELPSGSEVNISSIKIKDAPVPYFAQLIQTEKCCNGNVTEIIPNGKPVISPVCNTSPVTENTSDFGISVSASNCCGGDLLILPLESLDLSEAEEHPSDVALPTLEENDSEFLTYMSPNNSMISRTSSTKLVKTVSFADEIGKSLTETFVFDSNLEKHPGYNTNSYRNDCDYTSFSIQHKTKVGEKKSPSRFTRSRLRHRVHDPLVDYYSLSDRYSEYETPAQLSRTNEQLPVYVWNINFLQPAAQYYEFRKKVERNSVSLESISLNQSHNNQLPDLSGTIKVVNLAFVKHVWLRITVDHWNTFTEQQATYSQLLSGSHLQTPSRFDTFTFQVSAASLLGSCASSDEGIGVDRIEFAIRYSTDQGTRQYWDNNDGQNYSILRSQNTANWPLPTERSNADSHVSPPPVRNNVYCSPAQYTVIDNQSQPYTPDYLPNFSGVTSFTDYRVWTHFMDETVYY